MADKETGEKHYKGQWETTDADHFKKEAEILEAFIRHYKTPEKILDFGSGSGLMTKELRNRGLDVTPIEPMIHGYLKDQHFAHKFDVVLGIEVIEHLTDVWTELNEIAVRMTDNGIMLFTTLLTNTFIDLPDADEHFGKWWYKDDPTHVSFFCNKTLVAISKLGKFNVSVHGNKVFVLRLGQG